MSQLHHILNRGVDKRKIFLDKRDHYRFIHDLFEFNNEENVSSNFFFFNHSLQTHDIGCREFERKPRKLLVHIHTFCMMPNHYHLLLEPVVEDGIPRFMKKLNMGYAKYFNKKYERTGALFEGRYKSVLIDSEAHFTHLPFYIHLNPLDLVTPGWREWKIENIQKTIDFLESYRWSSHLDYLGKKNFSSVTQREFLNGYFESEGGYEHVLKKRLEGMEEEAKKGIGFADLEYITLE